MSRTVELVEADRLHPHEAYKRPRLETVLERIRATREVDLPIVVDRESLVIVDGHHRWWACRLLGCRLVPVVLVDYTDDAEVRLTVRPESTHQGIGKRDVVEAALAGRVYPHKTTKHYFAFDKAGFPPTPLERLDPGTRPADVPAAHAGKEG